MKLTAEIDRRRADMFAELDAYSADRRYVDPEPARARLLAWRAAGHSLASIAFYVGMSVTRVREITNGAGRHPRILRGTSDLILESPEPPPPARPAERPRSEARHYLDWRTTILDARDDYRDRRMTAGEYVAELERALDARPVQNTAEARGVTPVTILAEALGVEPGSLRRRLSRQERKSA